MSSHARSSLPTRRTVLTAAAAVSLAGCSVFGQDEAAPDPLPPSPDDRLRDRVVTAEHSILARYEATTEAYPELAEDLAAFADRHQRHIDAVQATAPPPTPAAEATAPPPTPAAEATAPPPTPAAVATSPAEDPPVPADPGAAVDALREAESAAAADRLDDCLDARDGGLARVLAGIAACESGHDVLLDRIGG